MENVLLKLGNREEYYQHFCVFEAQSHVALFINNSDLLFAKQLLQSTNVK